MGLHQCGRFPGRAIQMAPRGLSKLNRRSCKSREARVTRRIRRAEYQKTELHCESVLDICGHFPSGVHPRPNEPGRKLPTLEENHLKR